MPTAEDRLNALEIARATHEAQYEFIVQSLVEIKGILNNGIRADVQALKIWHEEHEKDSNENRDNWKKILFPVVSQIIVSLLTIIAALMILQVPPFK